MVRRYERRGLRRRRANHLHDAGEALRTSAARGGDGQGGDRMNRHRLMVSDPHIRTQLQLAGLRFMCTRARWLDSEAMQIGVALKSGAMTSDEADARLDEMGALDLVYPELMGCPNDE